MEQKDGKKPVKNNEPADEEAGVEVTFYTDPLCCWTWAMRPQWERFQAEMALSPSQIRYKMGGLLPSWDHFQDSVNSIRKPFQMGPEWHHAMALSGQSINDKIWITDPPASSFPACIAVKCVELQSPLLAARYFDDLQQAVMVRSQNIAKTAVLLNVAVELCVAHPSFNIFQFREDLFGQAARSVFRRDLQECKYLNIHRLPTLLFRAPAKRTVLITGYQSYESLRTVWQKLRSSDR